MRFFNTEGPVRPDLHYYLPPLERWDLDEILTLIERQKYFLLHAPRQTGKTSCLLALMQRLMREGRCRVVYANLETAQTARGDADRGTAAICGAIAEAVGLFLDDPSLEIWWEANGQSITPEQRIRRLLAHWTQQDPRPAILLLDEVDALIGDTLIALLRALRAGYTQRPEHFPQTVMLCGVRDLRDYRIHSESQDAIITGGSAFNIKAKSLRLGDFDQLADKLREPRVRRIIEPMLAGGTLAEVPEDDIQYLIDLGLCRMDDGEGLTIANPIYRELLPRVLTFTPQASLPSIQPTWLDPDGSLNPERLLAAFIAFWSRHGEPLLAAAPYHEIAPHLVLMTFLQRVVNGNGTLEREYAIGRGRMDLCLNSDLPESEFSRRPTS